MDAISNSKYSNRLRQRRQQIEAALQYINNERRNVEENVDGMDRRAYESRVIFFAELTESFREETVQIEHAFARITKGTYGLCLRCRGPVESEWLDLWPDTQFCFDCHESEERSPGELGEV